MHQGNYFCGWQYFVHTPTIGHAYIHIFNKAQRNTASTEMLGHWNDLIGIGLAFDHHIDFDAQASFLRRFNTIEHIAHREVHIVHGPKHGIV